MHPVRPRNVVAMDDDHFAAEIDIAATDAIVEADRGVQLYGPLYCAHQGLGVLTEEFEELKDQVKIKQRLRDPEKLRAEAIQVAAVALKIAAMSRVEGWILK